MKWLWLAAGLLLVAFAVSLVARWAAKRGWVYHRRLNPRPKGAGVPMLLERIYQPTLEHVIEERGSQAIRADQDESGEGDGSSAQSSQSKEEPGTGSSKENRLW